ncbi:hypothetical protein [Methylobacterium flocculans]|uniref:hypothetical protein n=1 Tax=Methylobacterium flocculans TaxID=2984843 RepID=UPI0021F3217C|nr:hypothetical protein [Methylobacterium sp. FF17]
MLAKIRGAHRMVTADDELAFVRPGVVKAIEILRGRGLSQMGAYEVLAGQVGKSPSWVRGIVGRDPSIGVRLRDALNLSAAYERLCKRIEAAADAEEARIATLTEELHAALAARDPVAPSTLPAAVNRAAAPRRAVRPTVPALAPAHARSRAARVPLDLNDLPLWRASHEEK